MLSGQEGITVVGEAGTGEAALNLAGAEAPDVLLLDVALPDISGIEVARKLKRDPSAPAVLALSSYDDPEYMESGARGYLTKEKAPALIAEAVRAVAHGEVRWFVQPAAGQGELLKRLTGREREVLTLIAEGCANEEVAERLHISGHTARSHTSSIYEKISVSSGREAVAWAWQSGLMGH